MKTEEILAELKTAFEQFKRANDERLAEIEKKGHADPVLVEKVDKANAAVSELQAKLQEVQKAQEDRLAEMEKAISRPAGVGASGSDDVASHALAFKAMVTGKPVEEVTADIDEYLAYKKAFVAYLRRGQQALAAPDIQAALSVGSDPDGGYWVTPDTGGRIVEMIYESSPMRQIAAVDTIGTDALEGLLDLDEADTGWVGETETRSETGTPTIGEYRIEVHEMYSMPKATQRVLDDATRDVEGWLARKVADKMARVESAAFITGSGVKQPRGFLTYPAGTPSSTTWDVIQQINSGAAGGFATSNPGDKLIDLVFALKAFYRNGAAWMMNRSTVAEVRKLKDGQGNYLWQPEFTARQGGLLLGYPIVEAEDMPDIAADSLSIAFGNFRIGYQIVDRQGIRVLRDPYTTKGYVKFYTTRRVGGDVVNFEAIKIMKFAA